MPGFYDTNGIWIYSETDPFVTTSAALNIGQRATSDAIAPLVALVPNARAAADRAEVAADIAEAAALVSLPLIAPANTAVAAFVTVAGPTRTALLAALDAKGSIAVNVKDYGAIGDGVTDDTTAIQNAINATPAGLETVFEPGKTYRLTAALVNAGRSVRIRAHGATIVQSGNARALSFSGLWDASVTVSALATSTIVETDGNILDKVTLTVSGTMPWKRGDVVKVFSSDVIPGVRSDNGIVETQESRTGQFFTVHSVSANAVTLLGTLRDPMTANIKVARLPFTTCQISGGTFDVSDASITAGHSSDLINLSAMHRPIVENVSIKRANGAGIVMYSNFGYEVRGSEVLWAWNDGSIHFGYGVADNASANGIVDGCFFGQVRHGFTDTNTTASAGEDTPSKYGRSVDWKVSNCVADSTTSSGFDTHQGGESGTFENCVAINAIVGFAIRGRGHAVLNCRTKSCQTAVRIFTEGDTGGDTWGTIVDGLKAEGTKTLVLSIDLRWYSSHYLYNVRDTRPIFVSNVKATDTAGNFLRVVNATALFDNVFCEFRDVAGSGVTITNSRATFTNIVLDYFRSTGAGHVAFTLSSGAASNLQIDGLRIRGYSQLSTRLSKVFSCDTTQVLRISNALVDFPPSVAFTDIPVGGSWVDYAYSVSGGSNSGLIELDDAGALSVTTVAGIARTRAPYVSVVVALTGANRTLAYLPAAQIPGQLLSILNLSATYSLTVANSTSAKTALDAGANKTLTPGQTLLLVALASGLWRQIKSI